MYFIDPDGMQADDWKRDINGKMVYDKNLNQFNQSYTLGIGEQYVGSSHYEPTGSNSGLSYNEDGTIDNVTVLNEVVISASRPTGTTTDGLKVWGVGGDAVAGSGNMKGDRGSGSIEAETAVGDVGMLFEFGNKIVGTAINIGLYLIDEITPNTPFTNDTANAFSSPKPDSPKPVSEDTTISLVENHYVKNTYYNGKSKTVPRVSFSKDTTVSKKDVNKVRDNNNKKNQSNYKNAK